MSLYNISVGCSVIILKLAERVKVKTWVVILELRLFYSDGQNSFWAGPLGSVLTAKSLILEIMALQHRLPTDRKHKRRQYRIF